MRLLLQTASILVLLSTAAALSAADSPDFNTHVLPIFRKYCIGCHNAKDAEGGLILEDYARTMKGGDSGIVVIGGKTDVSRMWRLLTGREEPAMPPKDQLAPKPTELAVIQKWIEAGSPSPSGGPNVAGLVTPRIETRGDVREPITSLGVAPNGEWIAVARPHRVDVLKATDRSVLLTLTGHTGQINDTSFSADSQWLAVASGESGLNGEATLWKTSDWSRSQVLRGHRDSIYGIRLSPDSRLIATASYDREIQIWDAHEGKSVATLSGHNDAVYGLSFSCDGKLLASASGDRTIKLWDIAAGRRLDTFSQPARDQYSVAFHPAGSLVVAGGVDCRLRVWQVSDSAKEGTNPILYARFAHEGPILKVAFAPDGRLLATASEDGLIKIWETRTFTQVAVLEKQPDWTAALSFSADNRALLVGRMNGNLASYLISPTLADSVTELATLSENMSPSHSACSDDVQTFEESEPNDEIQNANRLSIPGSVKGQFKSISNRGSDLDLYRIDAKAGQIVIVETNASRNGSSADTKIEILHVDGRPVVRALLQAVRNSWINFRPIDSSSADVRLEFWEEMDLNQYVYLNGEVCKTFRAPQGPDSGFQLYTLNGKRRGYFDTSATAHAKDEPCYVVDAYPAGSRIVENGLPVFPLDYSNDDDADRKLDRDSRLTFTAPVDGSYVIRVTDVRGFTGDNFHYSLTVRDPKPDFSLTVNSVNPKVPAGSGQRLKFTLNRMDGFDGDVRLDIAGLPKGFSASSPVLIPTGHVETTSVITATVEAVEPTKEESARVTVLATGTANGRLMTKTVGSLGEIKLEKPPVFRVRLLPDDPSFVSDDGGLTIRPGSTITAKIVLERNGFDGDVKFDVDNLPHGVIVDNIGLSGVLVRAKETERQIFLTARPWVPETVRLIHAVAQVQGNQASPPLLLRVHPTRITQFK